MNETVSAFTITAPMLNFERIARHELHSNPYRWASIDGLFSPDDAAALAGTYPGDHYKRLSDYGGEKDFEYESRGLIGMGADTVTHASHLSPAWLQLAEELNSPDYKRAMSSLVGIDLSNSPLEVNVFHYPPGGSLGPHPDLQDKIVTHILYFNDRWDLRDGGCLTILRSADATDVVEVIPPLVGNSAVLVRSDNSWHAVSPVVKSCRTSRRSLTATFYRNGSVSTMWPPGDNTPLHEYPQRRQPFWKRVVRRLAS